MRNSVVCTLLTFFSIIFSTIPWSLELLLRGTSELEASDLRDKVVGLLGLAVPESVPRSLVPNYYSSGVADIYREVTRALVDNTGSLRVFEDINYNCGQQYNKFD